MKFIPFAIVSMCFGVLSTFAQVNSKDSTQYYQRKLKIEEVNFVSGYYSQNGNNSAVTGGVGTEKLTDLSNILDLRIAKYDRAYRKHTFTLGVGIDSYTSASSDRIDDVISSASADDVRIYPSFTWNVQNEKRGTTFGFTGSTSWEYDYKSIGAALNFSQLSKDRNREFNLKAQAFFDTWKVILPLELRPFGYGSGSTTDLRPVDYSPRNSFSLALSLSQVINKRIQFLISLEPAYQYGLLATKYQRVYFTNNSAQVETLPERRYKLPIGFRMNYFLTDRIILRSFYRYYMDDWGIRANTAEIEIPYKLNSFLSISPFYRFHDQSAAKYFAPFATHQIDKLFFTSDYDLAKLNSIFIGAGFRVVPPKGILGITYLNSFELRYGYYMQSNGLNSHSFGLSLSVK